MSDAAAAHEHGTSQAASEALLDVVTPLSAEEVVRRLDTAARRGRVPGFQPRTDGPLFVVDGCGTPFEHHLLGFAATEGNGVRVRFELERQKRTPLIFAALIAVSVWPGVYFMDQLIPGEWGWIPTWTWYLPLTILPVPFYWRSTARKSRRIAEEDARKVIESIRAELAETSPQAA